ncbi:AAA family ATPase [candidate division KSB1 bacterium]|nr:AAA family ATPase [candidate division KSB1 bacterium]
MIKELEIKNFKSIKHLKLDCKRVNVFIGKPNAGKSNLLESVGVFSLPFRSLSNVKAIQDFIRLESMVDLFHDHDLNESVEVRTDKVSFKVEFDGHVFKNAVREEGKDSDSVGFDVFFNGDIGNTHSEFISPFRFYRFTTLDQYARPELDFLLPPKGENLCQILLTRKDLRKFAADLLRVYGLKLALKQLENKIEIQKEIEDVVFSSSYSLLSDTLQRAIFYNAAIDTNKDAIIILEEPEAHAFPYYTKFLAERIALDASNQYFVATHNPYFLSSVLEKTPQDDLAIFIAYFEGNQTKLRSIAQEEMVEVLDLDADVFFNLERFVEHS